MSLIAQAALIIAAFGCGSIPFGSILARARGVDIQKVGSGNIGATNVARNLGKKLGALVLALDAAKGALPVALGAWLAFPTWVLAAAGFAAVAGHCFPPWLRFRGGKGVATSLGVFLVLDPRAAAICLALFVAVYALFRIASLGSLVGAVAFPALAWWRLPADRALLALSIAIAALVVLQHRDNIRRLWHRREPRVD